MFRNSRPVPSAAALKVLYQLAYVSSGTAVGLAALCAEERRRRIQIVQKIADNAKVIRQHPRYNHSAALAVNDEDDGSFFGRTLAPESASNRKRRRAMRRQGLNDKNGDALVGPGLPSVIETEYANTFGSHRKPSRRRVRAKLRDQVDSSQRDRSASTYRSQHVADAEDARQQSARSQKQSSGVSPRNQESFVLRSVSHSRENRLVRKNIPGHRHSLTAFAERPKKTSAASYITTSAWTSHDDVDGPETDIDRGTAGSIYFSTEDIANDVDFFFRLGPPPALPNFKSEAGQLLRLALGNGSLDDIRSLCLWMLSKEAFTEYHGRRLVTVCEYLASRFDFHELFDFYAGIFATKAYGRLDPTHTFEQRLGVLVNTSEWDLDLKLREQFQALFVKSVRSLSEEDVVRIVTITCKDLLQEGKLSLAAELLTVFANQLERRNGSERSRFAPLADEVIESALDNGFASPFHRLLRWKLRFAKDDQSIPRQLDAFIKLCESQQRHDLLRDLLRKDRLSLPVDSLVALADDPSKAALAVACSSDARYSRAFQSIYDQLPVQSRLRISAGSSVRTLKSKWKSTRNLDAIEAELPMITNWLKENGDVRSLQKLDEAVLEIYIDANQIERALVCIARIQKTSEAEGATLSLAALLFATRGAWDRLHQLLEMAKSFKSITFDSDSTRIWNKVFHLYSRQHDAVETWKFVTDTMDKLGFQPNVATTQTVMISFALKGSIHLIPKWLGFLSSLDYRFELNARIAANVLKHFYLENRRTISHSVLFWLFRKLSYEVPSFKPELVTDLLKDAVGFDLRQLYGRNAPLLRIHARKRLEHLEAVEGYIPEPGFNSYGNLLFSDHDQMQECASRENASGHTELQSNEGYEHFETQSNLRPQDAGDALEHSKQADDASEEHYQELIAAFNEGDPEVAKEERDVQEADDRNNANFETLRPTYQRGPFDKSALVYALGNNNEYKLEYKMILALSLARYEEVDELYLQSCDASGLPASVRALEIAIQARLLQHNGNSFPAEKLINSAREAGMNVTCAMGPMLIHQMRHLDVKSRHDVNNLRTTVIEYYRMNDENGWPVQHHVGVTAADVLIRQGRAQYGLNILSAIYMSDWASRRSLDIVALTVFLKGYKVLQSIVGIRWVVQTVLSQNLPITRKFLRELRDTYRRPRFPTLRRRRALIISWIKICVDRRKKQMSESMKMGYELVDCIVQCSRGQRQLEKRTEEDDSALRDISGDNAEPSSEGTEEEIAPVSPRAKSHRSISRRHLRVAIKTRTASPRLLSLPRPRRRQNRRQKQFDRGNDDELTHRRDWQLDTTVDSGPHKAQPEAPGAQQPRGVMGNEPSLYKPFSTDVSGALSNHAIYGLNSESGRHATAASF